MLTISCDAYPHSQEPRSRAAASSSGFVLMWWEKMCLIRAFDWPCLALLSTHFRPWCFAAP